MTENVKQYIKEHAMLQNKDRIIVGVSGGADSICLLFMLSEFKKEYELELIAVHINHGIRGEDADLDALYVENICKEKDIICYQEKVDIREIAKERKISEEEAGRIVRYEVFEKILIKTGGNKIAVAHNKNDQAETIFWNFIRGSALLGLSGMKPVRGYIIRPLLCVDREEIEKYLNRLNISYRTDYTNNMEIYTRNKIRLNLLPYIEKNIHEGVKDNIVRNALHFNEINEYIIKNTQNAYDKIIKNESNRYYVNVIQLSSYDIVIQKGLIRKIIEELSGRLKDIDSKHIEMVLLLKNKNVGRYINLPYKIIAVRTYEEIKLYLKSDKEDDVYDTEVAISQKITVPGNYFFPKTGQMIEFKLLNNKKNILIPKKNYTKFIDYDKIRNTMLLRTRLSGDYITIDDNKQKKLKKFFIDEKVPKEIRDDIPIIADGSHVIWIIGYRISEAYKITDDTNRILEIKINGGKEDV